MADTVETENAGPIGDFPLGLRGDGTAIRDFPLKLSDIFWREFPGDGFERLSHEGAGRIAGPWVLASDDE